MMYKQDVTIDKETEDIKETKEILERKSTATEVKNSLGGKIYTLKTTRHS